MSTNELPLEAPTAEVQRLRDAGEDLLLVDCREAEEAAIAHIDGALLLPMSQWLDRAGELAGRESQRIVVYCHHGMRSLSAVRWLRERGYAQAQSLAGGIDRWAVEAAPGMARY